MEETKALEVRIEQKLGILNWNFEELNRQLDVQLEKYRGLTFTDDQMPEAKKTRAALNKVAKEINDRKIAVKKEFCQPYTEFEEQAKQLIRKINDVSGEIDAQVKDYEEQRRADKRKRIEAWWAENGKHTVELEKIWKDSWLNTTCSDEKWKQELEAEKVRIEKERLEQERQQREAKRAEVATNPAPVEATEPKAEDDPDDYLYSPTFKLIDLTYSQAMDITNYMKKNGLRFVSVAKERREK